MQAPAEYEGRGTKCLACGSPFTVVAASPREAMQGSSTFAAAVPRRSDGHQKYPNLIRYLAWGRILSTMFWSCFAGLGLLSLATGLLTTFSDSHPYGGIRAALLGAIMLPLAYLGYLVWMAGIEFTYVIIDIEANTRRQ